MIQEFHQEQNRPLIVESQNLKHSKNLVYPNEPPTKWQIIKLKHIGYKGKIPCCRALASFEIRKIKGELSEDEIKNGFKHE